MRLSFVNKHTMGLQYHNIVLVAIIIYLTTAINTSSAQTPKRCCTPNVYTTGLSSTASQTGSPPVVTNQEGLYYYDALNNRTAVNVTVINLTSQVPVQQVFEILDYGKHTQFTIIDGKTCYKTSLGDFPSNGCLPDNAQFKGTVKYGETLAANRWSIDVPGTNQDISMTVDKCVPVTSTILLQSGGLTFVSQDYYNLKESIQNPDKIFTPPKICDKASLVVSSKSTDENVSLKGLMKQPFLL